ncbi:MAG: hypothetical protein JW822_10155 [Spirochaetales bacterium]|nr:hypothetical protein [Spirochaetales bacterium]
MKPRKIILSICAFCFFVSMYHAGLSAEEPLIVLVREIWEWDTGVSCIIYYDMNGDVVEQVVEENGEEIYRCTFSYDYDDLGRKSVGYSEDTDGDSAVYAYAYNENDQVVTREWEWTDSDSGSFTAYYEYNDNNDIVEYLMEDNKAEELVYSYTVSYDYDEYGRKIKGYVEDSYDETAVVTYEYEEIPVIE